MALTTVLQSLEVDGMRKMTAVREDVLPIILVKKERVTVSLTLIVSNQDGQNVEMICVSTLNISQLQNTQTTQPGLDLQAQIIAAIESVIRITTDVEMELQVVKLMEIVMMGITVILTWNYLPVMNSMNAKLITRFSMEPHIVGLSPLAPIMLVVSPALVTLDLLLMYPMLDAGTRMSALKVVTHVRQILTVGTGMGLIIVLAR